MAWKQSPVTVVAVMAMVPPGVVACGRSAGSGGTAPPGSGLVSRHGGNSSGQVGDLGGLPGRDPAGSGLRLWLSGEHRGLADVRIPAQADAGSCGGAAPG